MVNNINKFLKVNTIISCVAFISTAIIVAYILSMDKPEWFLHAGDWFNVLFQLAIGFDINFIFYITQVYVPRVQQNKKVNACIYERLSKIESYMNMLLTYIAEVYVKDYKPGMELTPEQLSLMLHKLDFNDKVNLVNSSRINTDNKYFSVKELISDQTTRVEMDIDKLYSFYAAYISPELMKVLEEILNSSVHVTLAKEFIRMPINILFDENSGDMFFGPYYRMMHDLARVKYEYKE